MAYSDIRISHLVFIVHLFEKAHRFQKINYEACLLLFPDFSQAYTNTNPCLKCILIMVEFFFILRYFYRQ